MTYSFAFDSRQMPLSVIAGPTLLGPTTTLAPLRLALSKIPVKNGLVTTTEEMERWNGGGGRVFHLERWTQTAKYSMGAKSSRNKENLQVQYSILNVQVKRSA